MKPCPDCKATPGLYVGLFQTEKCKTCDGTTLVPEEKQAPAPKPFDPSDYLGCVCHHTREKCGVFLRYHDVLTDTSAVLCNTCGSPPPEYLLHEQVRFTVGFAQLTPTPQSFIRMRSGPWWRTPVTKEWAAGHSWAVGHGTECATPGPEPTDSLPLVHLETVEEFRAFAAHFKIEIVE